MIDHIVSDDGFTNSEREYYGDDSNDVSYQATAYALEILGDYNLLEEKDLFGKVTTSHNSSDLQEELEDGLTGMYEAGFADLYDTYYILESLEEMDYEISGTTALLITSFLGASMQIGGGISGSDKSSDANLISTYYAFMIYDLLDQPIPNILGHRNFVASCANPDGGYSGDPGSSSTLANTYYAVLVTEYLEDIKVILNPDLTIDYLNSFYVDEEDDKENYGGYLPDHNAENAHLSSTYYCIRAVEILDEEELEDKDSIAEWVLSRQNFQDGGFVDTSDGYKQKYSSVVNTYFAHEILDIIERKELLDEKIFMLEFEWWDWLIFWIIICSLCVLAIYGIYIWRKRKV